MNILIGQVEEVQVLESLHPLSEDTLRHDLCHWILLHNVSVQRRVLQLRDSDSEHRGAGRKFPDAENRLQVPNV